MEKVMLELLASHLDKKSQQSHFAIPLFTLK
jgi:hypothetical protein